MDSLSYIPPAVEAAHKAGRKMIMAVGEQGLGSVFASAASPRYQATLITSITHDLAKYGFDGVDVDWEEDVPQNEASYVSLMAPQIDESLCQFPSVTPAGPGFWNFGFFMLDNGLPERIVGGQEDTWIAGFVDWLEVVKGAVDPDAVTEYAAHLRRPGHLAASYAYFGTFHRDVEETIRHRETPLAMPVLAIGGEGALGQAIPDQMQLYADDVTGAVLPCGHWVAEESPELLLKHLLPFLG